MKNVWKMLKDEIGGYMEVKNKKELRRKTPKPLLSLVGGIGFEPMTSSATGKNPSFFNKLQILENLL